MPRRIGVFADAGRLTVVALRGRAASEHFVVTDPGNPAMALAAELEARGLIGAGRVGLDRGLVLVKVIRLPRADGARIEQMIGFEIERHVPFAPEQTRFAWVELPSGPAASRSVLVVAAEGRTVDRTLALISTARRRAATLTVACHELPALLPRSRPARRTVWAHRHGDAVDLLLLADRTLFLSRRVVPGDAVALAREIGRTLSVAGWVGSVDAWLSGDEASAWRADLAGSLGEPVSAPPYAAAWNRLIGTLPADNEGAALLALAVAAGPHRPALDLLPAAQRPWVPSRQQLVTASLGAAATLLGLGLALAHVVQTERYVARVAHEIRRLDQEVKTVDGMAAALATRHGVLAAIETADRSRIHAVSLLHELTETLPMGAWLQGLTVDRQGVELIGTADGASTLIPLLEASRRLERVEFTSPVTRAQGKEQFRIRAAWERED